MQYALSGIIHILKQCSMPYMHLHAVHRIHTAETVHVVQYIVILNMPTQTHTNGSNPEINKTVF